ELVQMALQPTVRAELKTTEAQNKKIDEARDAWLDFVKEYPDLPGAEQKAAREAKTKAGEKLLAAALDAGQLRRLRQITNQLSPRMEPGIDPVSYALLYEYPQLGEQLKITKEQREAARKVEKEFSEAERKLVLSEKPAAEIEKGLKQLEEATTVRFRALL